MDKLESFLFPEKPIEGTIAFALNELSEFKSFDEITVGEICETASVSRSTFYRFFSGKEDVQKLCMRSVSAIGFEKIGRTLSLHDGLTLTLAGTKRLGNSFKSVRSSADSRNAVFFGMDFVEHHCRIFAETITRYKRVRFGEGLEFVLHAWVCLLNDCLNDWRVSGFEMPIEVLVGYLERTMPPELHELLKDPSV